MTQDERWTPEFKLFHQLWGKAVGTADYVKSDWQKLEHELFIKPRLAESSINNISDKFKERLKWWKNNLAYKAPEQLRDCLNSMFNEFLDGR